MLVFNFAFDIVALHKKKFKKRKKNLNNNKK